ncbi:MAG: hypothetical protein ACI837_000343 [Crocinitomicaceae bacterium]|jgi:hypothetical protein
MEHLSFLDAYSIEKRRIISFLKSFEEVIIGWMIFERKLLSETSLLDHPPPFFHAAIGSFVDQQIFSTLARLLLKKIVLDSMNPDLQQNL